MPSTLSLSTSRLVTIMVYSVGRGEAQAFCRYVPPFNVLTAHMFPDELFSVSPWMTKSLQNLFVLNERVAMLGGWRYGFFGMAPVSSAKINFDTVCTLHLHYLTHASLGTLHQCPWPSASTGTYDEAATLPRPCSTASLSRPRRRCAGSVWGARPCLWRSRRSSLP